MCTAISFKTKDHYFGRNLDYEYSYHETVTVMARNYPLNFRKIKAINSHYAMIGMAYVVDNYPLYYDATNEKGLSIAGLNFPRNAYYAEVLEDKENISPFEFIPFILATCQNIKEVKIKLQNLNLCNINFSTDLPLSPLHWMIADEEEAITVEAMRDGLKVYDNPVKVLTNNPPFDFHLLNLANYLNVTPQEVTNRFIENINILPYSRGMGSIGLPGDYSSASRFVKAAFVLHNSKVDDNESSSVNQFFHILGSVSQEKGCVAVNNKYEYTIYSSCCNTKKGLYYYTTYDNSRINMVDMYQEDLDSNQIYNYPLNTKWDINIQNKKH